eukprot:7646472-Alexandrium_andersonii.AAC.1
MFQKAIGKSSGVDGWGGWELSLLPAHSSRRLCDFLHRVEREGRWPPNFLQWRVAFIPKASLGLAATPLRKLRPISV